MNKNCKMLTQDHVLNLLNLGVENDGVTLSRPGKTVNSRPVTAAISRPGTAVNSQPVTSNSRPSTGKNIRQVKVALEQLFIVFRNSCYLQTWNSS